MKKLLYLICTLVIFTSCHNESDDSPNKQTYDSDIVINASNDGGSWWYPQGIDCDPALDHQGKELVDFLKQKGYSVYESCRQENVEISDYPKIKLLIVAGSYLPYSDAESQIIFDYVSNGGKLMLLLDHTTDNTLANKFGLDFQNTNTNNIKIEFLNHEITQNIDSVYETSGVSGLNNSELSIDIIAKLDNETYLDTNSNGIQDQDEIASPILIGTMDIEQGKVLFSGDINIWQQKPNV
jgi:hypothetical protein